MDIKIISEEKETKDSVPMHSESLDGPILEQLENRAMGQVMGLETESDFSKHSDDLRTLLQYAKSQTQDHSPESLKWVIRSLELKLGTPPFAENRVKFVRQYAWLLMEEKRIADTKKKFERI